MWRSRVPASMRSKVSVHLKAITGPEERKGYMAALNIQEPGEKKERVSPPPQAAGGMLT